MKVISAAQAAALIPDGAHLVVCGTGPVLEPDALLEALEERHLADGHPRNLTLTSTQMVGERPGQGGLNVFAHPGLLRRFIGSSLSVVRHPGLVEMFRQGQIEGYMMGMGTILQTLQAAGSKKPGVFTTVGLGTFLDPRCGGGRMNERSTETLAEVVQWRDQEYLFYPASQVDLALIRATAADQSGYLSLEEETNSLGVLDMALAAKANGGVVIAQVRRLVARGGLDARLVKVPGPLVDYVVVHPAQRQLTTAKPFPGYGDGFNPVYVGAAPDPLLDLRPPAPGPSTIVLRRAALELADGDVVNLGAGLPTGLPVLAQLYGWSDAVTFTNEHGVFGGLMTSAVGGSFVPAINPGAVMDSSFQFAFYDAGLLDVTFLGAGEIDAQGNVNVSKFGRQWVGTGGFSDITDRTGRIVICGTMTAGGLATEVAGERLTITQEGRHRKFVPQVEEVTLSGRRAFQQGQRVTYVTERAVFQLDRSGVVLTEVAPGVDIDRDIRPAVGFELRLSDRLTTMPAVVFSDDPIPAPGA
ncbi:MAG: hypothetical protein LBJ44_09190 [Propionibacteriaceae bacterium]|jgi:acyl CoA:acetate/3-ketoacid CoA transferase|nr:hypothetical protein [Propionibacteriaceae bacterium]